MKDPRKAQTLGGAAQNPDGTYNGLKMLSWLSECVAPGKGMSLEEVQEMWEKVKAKKEQEKE